MLNYNTKDKFKAFIDSYADVTFDIKHTCPFCTKINVPRNSIAFLKARVRNKVVEIYCPLCSKFGCGFSGLEALTNLWDKCLHVENAEKGKDTLEYIY